MSQQPVFFVDGPPPVAPRFRLTETLANLGWERSADSDHWMLGARMWAYSADLPFAWDPCSAGTFRVKDDGDPGATPDFGTFVAVVGETCSTLTVGVNQNAFAERARRVFDARESYAVEKELATGNALGDAFPKLQDATLLNSGTAVSSKAGLALLEDAIGATASGGIIHATPGTGSAWGEFRLTESNGVLRTTVGTPVAVGDGYIGVTPDDDAGALSTGQAWAFATGPMEMRRGALTILPGDVREAMDRENNTVTYRAERPYLLTWDDTFLVAVLIDWTL